jgi:endonuclease/exonuclease/phosphatase family metal-dependent hydrolase
MATLKIATYNIRAAIGAGPWPAVWWREIDRDRIARIGQVIAAMDADVIALQEVPLTTIDGETLSIAPVLADRLGLDQRFGAVRHFPLIEPETGRSLGAGMFGNALLSRLPIRSSRVVGLFQARDDDLVEPPGSDHPSAGLRYGDTEGIREPRCVLLCEIDMDADTRLTVASTHLTHIGREQRRRQTDDLRAALPAGGRVALAGDLNAPIEADELAALRERFGDAFDLVRVPPRDARRESCGVDRIDHILVEGLAVRHCAVWREAGDASDHLPVVAVVET